MKPRRSRGAAWRRPRRHCGRGRAGRLRLDGAALRAARRAGGRELSPTRPTPRAAVAPAADIAWQQFFIDPRLKRLIELALQNNRDLRVAVLNIDRTRAQYQIQRSTEVPNVFLGATGLSEPDAVGQRQQHATTPPG